MSLKLNTNYFRTAVMYVKKEYQELIQNPIVSNTSDTFPNSLQKKFSWSGTIDYSKFVVIPDAIDFHISIGGTSYINQKSKLLKYQVFEYIKKKWNTEILDSDCLMSNIALPIHSDIQEIICKELNLYIPVYQFDHKWWLRLSFHVYNNFNDYKKLFDFISLYSNSKL
jgi:selenocysteine lyase/cysteine desulfurase